MSKQYKEGKKITHRNKKKRILNKRYVIETLKTKKEYHFAGEFGKVKYVLDFGCGPGFGSEILSRYAKKIIGVDIRTKAINYAKSTYKKSNLAFQVISPSKPLPFEDNFFDVIISSHVIEHIPEVSSSLKELKRILKINGTLIISTPNRKFRLLPFQKPYNPYHLREYTPKSFKKELKKIFQVVTIKGVYGTKKITIIEKKRKKALKNPLKVYIYSPITFIVRKILPNKSKSFLRKTEEKLIEKSHRSNIFQSAEIKVENKFTLKNIIIGNNLKLSSDLLAICQNL